MKTTILILLATVSIAHAGKLGDVGFSGDFTLNHLYDFNNPGAQPFGTFSDQTVIWSQGIFTPYIHAGQTVAGQELWSAGHSPPLFSIGGYTVITEPLMVNINGPDSGRYVFGWSEINGNGYHLSPDFSFWTFFAPPYDISDFHEDVTGPIQLQFVAIDAPDTGSTLALMGIGLLGMFVFARRFFAMG